MTKGEQDGREREEEEEEERVAHASDDLHEFVCISLWDDSCWVHLVDDERETTGAKLLDEEVA